LDSEYQAHTSSKFPSIQDHRSPKTVKAKSRQKDDMEALAYLMESASPLPRRVRSKQGKTVVYCFGDASSSGFGITLEINGEVYYEYGQWNEVADNRSSNWREAKNLLEGLRRAISDHELNGLEIFIFTDNTTAEATFWKGWSKNKSLSNIVLELRKLEMQYDVQLHVIHVSGSRMIRQGTDGLSRADHLNGVMNGEPMRSFVPLHLSAFERSKSLRQKCETSLAALNLKFLKPKEWFEEFHTFGNFVWTPPPAATMVAVELLNKARHKRPESLHIVLVPRLMTGYWRRMLTRTSDFCFRISCEDSWSLKEQHEPLLCFLCLPLSVSRPKLRFRRELLEDMERVLLQPKLQKEGDSHNWDLLCKFLLRARSLCAMPSSVLQ